MKKNTKKNKKILKKQKSCEKIDVLGKPTKH